MATVTKKASECPNITITPCESQQVHGYGFCDKTNTLAMQFNNKSGLSPVYHYAFTPEQYAALEKDESKGKHFGAHIKSLDCCKVLPDDDKAAA